MRRILAGAVIASCHEHPGGRQHRVVDLLAIKLTVTPLAVGLATLAGRRWGPSVGGWVAGIPFTSMPVVLFIALDHGSGLATLAAGGVLAGTASQAAFALFYSVAAMRWRWFIALPVASGAFAAATFGLNNLTPSPLPALEIVVGSIVLAMALMPRSRPLQLEAVERQIPLQWDIALRAVVATAFVVVLTSIVTAVGPTLAGLISPFPLFATVLIVFPHRLQGGEAAIRACRGFLWGLFAFGGFGFVLSELLPTFSLAVAFIAAIAVALAIQAVTLVIVRRRRA